MRITTNAILRNYKSNLGASLTNLDTARTKVMTGRQFTRAAENPASALRAAVLERKYVRNQDYLQSVDDVQSFQDAQEDGAMQINDISLKLSKQYGLEALSGTNQSKEVRDIYAEAWRGAQQNMVLALNTTYEDKYAFGGAEGAEPPFSLEKDANGNDVLKYRGIDVTTTDPDELEVLAKMSKETSYVDLGFGLSIDDTGAVDPSSAFDTSLPGINLVGLGEDNMILLAGKIAKTLKEEDFDIGEYEKLLNKFDAGREKVMTHVTNLGTKTEFLTITKERLETNDLNLSKQIDNVVNVDMAGAITDFSWAQYAYNAALKVGNNILSPSFIDFMN